LKITTIAQLGFTRLIFYINHDLRAVSLIEC